MKTKIILITALLFSIVGCKPVYRQDATFQLNGTVKSFNGNPFMVAADKQLSLCVDVSYQTFRQKNQVHAGATSYCQTLVTDQNGAYSAAMTIQLKDRGIDAIQI